MRVLLFRLILCFGLLAFAPHAMATNTTTFSAAPANFAKPQFADDAVLSEDRPVVLTADTVDFLRQEDVIIAQGKVEVIQGDTLMLADQLHYNRRTGVVQARGNVSMMDAKGNVIFADEMELLDDMRSAVIEEFKARLTDDSMVAAARAHKVDDNVMEMENVVYSPCKVKCATDLEPGESPDEPLWQLRARHVKVDQEAQEVVYDDAWMELYGVPVAYTPYLSHATPDAPGKSGLVAPEFEYNDNLGNVYRTPFYWAIAPDREMLLLPQYSSQEGVMLRSQYEQRYDRGLLKVDGSLTRPRDRDALGNVANGQRVRGHLFADGKWDVRENSKLGFDIRRTTDDTYLRRYDIDGQTMLSSRLYGESYDFVSSSDRSSISAEALAFQGLAAGDNSDLIPMALPLVNFDYESLPAANGSRYFMNSNALLLTRELGAESRRLSNTVGWKLPYITDNGQVLEFSSQLRGDLYSVENVTIAPGREFSGVTGRVVPEASLMWRYPFMGQFSKTNVVVEPIANFVMSPNGGNPDSIPNEDSVVPEFTDSNLFSNNRFAGYDRIEQGPRMSYGLRGLVNYRMAYIDGLIGQNYRARADRNFPFSNDIDDHLSDYVGRIGLQFNPFYVAYRFRMDKETLTQQRKEVDLRYNGTRVSLMASYVSLENDPILASREEIVGSGYVTLTDNWLVGMTARQDLLIGQITNVGGEIVYKNECVSVSNMISREYTRDRDIKPNTSYLLRLSLKNLN